MTQLLQKADAVVGDLTITESRMANVDFTMPFTESGWSMVVSVQTQTSTGMFFFLKPLTPALWLASLAAFIFTGFVIWVIEHRINPEFRGTPLQQLGIIFHYAFSTLVFAQSELHHHCSALESGQLRAATQIAVSRCAQGRMCRATCQSS